jgi:hypothetical protein
MSDLRKVIFRFTVGSLTLTLVAVTPGRGYGQDADLILINARIWTGDFAPHGPGAGCPW